jgi:hypothetical protein
MTVTPDLERIIKKCVPQHMQTLLLDTLGSHCIYTVKQAVECPDDKYLRMRFLGEAGLRYLRCALDHRAEISR